MYGLVNQAIKDLVCSKFDLATWEKICKKAQIENSDFIGLHYYSDKITYDLVGAASQELNAPVENILQLFGRHWVLFTAQEGYGPMMDMFGASFKECLSNLNNLHSRMGMTMPKLNPPRFEFKEIAENEYELEYISERAGLCPMVTGLLQGLTEKFQINAKIEFSEHQGKKLFKINCHRLGNAS